MSADRISPPFYNRDFVESHFTPEEIEAQGKVVLYRSLNVNRAIGFIGSGLSIAYGRPRWDTLIDDFADILKTGTSKTDDLLKQPTPEELDERNEIKDVLDLLKTESLSGMPDPDLLPLRAHLQGIYGRKLQRHFQEKDRAKFDLEKYTKSQFITDLAGAKKVWGPILEGMKVEKSDMPFVLQHLDTTGVLHEISKALLSAIKGAPRRSAYIGVAEEILKKAESTFAKGPPVRCSVDGRMLVLLV